MTFHEIEVRAIDGRARKLAEYRGKTLLVVNVASRCGFTPQYRGLETLYRTYRDDGFLVLGFPCDQFGNQEPGDESEILRFCETNYDVTFPLFAKIDVNGSRQHPLYTFLKSRRRGILGLRRIQWNFTKFLVDGEGRVLRRYAPAATPEEIGEDLEKLLRSARSVPEA